VPAFVWIKNLGLINSHWGLILPSIAGQQVFAIFITRGFMASLPEELFEAARVDGATMFQLYWRIALPLSRPIVTVVVITSLLATWNDFVWPLIVIGSDHLRTIPVGLAFFQTQYQTSYGPQMAGYFISSLPLLLIFLFTSKEFVQGLTAGAVKF
jgi:raffinose/stachyose/melibiose transport system permease protein